MTVGHLPVFDLLGSSALSFAAPAISCSVCEVLPVLLLLLLSLLLLFWEEITAVNPSSLPLLQLLCIQLIQPYIAYTNESRPLFTNGVSVSRDIVKPVLTMTPLRRSRVSTDAPDGNTSQARARAQFAINHVTTGSAK